MSRLRATAAHAHHLTFAQPRAPGKKVSDEWTVPLCLIHHRSLHDVGDEEKWWHEHGIEPLEHAQKLWQKTHGATEAGGGSGEPGDEAAQLRRPAPRAGTTGAAGQAD